MGRGWRWSLVVLAGLLAPAGFYLWRSDAAIEEQRPRRTVQVSRGTLLRTVLATGVIRPVVGAEIDVGSRISGTVVHLPVAVGDRVEAGQLLAELDATVLEAARDEALAELELAQAQAALASRVLERRRRLVAAGLASDEDLETARRDLAVARARLEARRARLRSTEIELGYTGVTAPIGGVIAEVTTREGETVAADFSAPTFVTIVDLERLEVLAYVDETDIGRVFVGQPASFSVDTYPDVEFAAVVRAINPRAEEQGSVVNYVARLDFEHRAADYVLRPEMTAHVRLLLEAREAVLRAPRGALRRHEGRTHVVVRRADRWLEQEVEIGWRTESFVEVVSGLEEGETLELNPN